MLVQIPIVTKIIKTLGAIKSFTFATCLQAIFISVLPVIALIEDRTAFWILVSVHIFMFFLYYKVSITSINILVNNTISSELNATANGLAFMLGSLGRFISPFVFGEAYSWSLTNVQGIKSNIHPLGFPWNQYFSFFIWSLSGIVTACISTLVSKDADTMNGNKPTGGKK